MSLIWLAAAMPPPVSPIVRQGGKCVAEAHVLCRLYGLFWGIAALGPGAVAAPGGAHEAPSRP